MDKRVVLLTGAPGAGKTTVLAKTVVALNAKGYRVGGMISREIRQDGARVDFELVDLTHSKKGWLAHKKQKEGPQIGKYRVNLNDLNNIGAQAMRDAIETCEIIAIDEIGPMELLSEEFKGAVKLALSSGKFILAIVHWKAGDKLIVEAKSREDAETIIITTENRTILDSLLVEKALKVLTPHH